MRFVLTVLVVGAAVALEVGAPADTGPLRHARPDAEALARSVLDGLEDRDREALERLLVTREEHRELLWDALPESRTYPFAYVRRLTERSTGKGLDRALTRLGGRRLELVDLSFRKKREAYDRFTLHRGAVMTVRRPETGETEVLEILDVFVEWRGGRWKLMDYDD